MSGMVHDTESSIDGKERHVHIGFTARDRVPTSANFRVVSFPVDSYSKIVSSVIGPWTLS